jgi:hypothetical protein
MNKFKIFYWLSTGFLTLIMSFSAGMYIFNNAFVQEAFIALGYPIYIIYPLATAKLLGLVAIHYRKFNLLTNLAYAGFFYVSLLAISAHVSANDGGFFPGTLVFIAVIVSFYSAVKLKKVRI